MPHAEQVDREDEDGREQRPCRASRASASAAAGCGSGPGSIQPARGRSHDSNGAASRSGRAPAPPRGVLWPVVPSPSGPLLTNRKLTPHLPTLGRHLTGRHKPLSATPLRPTPSAPSASRDDHLLLPLRGLGRRRRRRRGRRVGPPGSGSPPDRGNEQHGDLPDGVQRAEVHDDRADDVERARALGGEPDELGAGRRRTGRAPLSTTAIPATTAPATVAITAFGTWTRRDEAPR